MRGGVLWEKPHYWKKFKLKSNYEKEKNVEITQQEASQEELSYLVDVDYFYERLSFLKSEEEFQGDGVKEHRYKLGDGFGFVCLKFAQSDDCWYKVTFYSDGSLSGAYRLGYRISYTDVFSHYSKGEFVEEVGAKDINAFPKDGQKGNFWYEFIN